MQGSTFLAPPPLAPPLLRTSLALIHPRFTHAVDSSIPLSSLDSSSPGHMICRSDPFLHFLPKYNGRSQNCFVPEVSETREIVEGIGFVHFTSASRPSVRTPLSPQQSPEPALLQNQLEMAYHLNAHLLRHRSADAQHHSDDD